MKHTILFLALAAATLSITLGGCAWNDYDQCSNGHRGVMHRNSMPPAGKQS
jgi:hypothetical protein